MEENSCFLRAYPTPRRRQKWWTKLSIFYPLPHQSTNQLCLLWGKWEGWGGAEEFPTNKLYHFFYSNYVRFYVPSLNIYPLTLLKCKYHSFGPAYDCVIGFSFSLEDNCFTILCWPLPYINMNVTGFDQSSPCHFQASSTWQPITTQYQGQLVKGINKLSQIDFLVVQWLRLIGWGTTSHMPQLMVLLPQLEISSAITKIWCSQIHWKKNFF